MHLPFIVILGLLKFQYASKDMYYRWPYQIFKEHFILIYCFKNKYYICQTLRRMKMKCVLSFIIVLLSMVLSCCSPYTLVNSEVYNNSNLASFKTFRIVVPDDTNKLPPTMEDITYYNIAQAIRTQMQERGYVENANSPLLINIGLSVQHEIQTAPLEPNYFPYYGPAPYPGYYPYFIYPRQYYWPSYPANAQVITGIYKEGVLTMDMINTVEKIPVYSSSVATIISNGQNELRNIEGIQKAVSTLFSKFPVPPLPEYKKK